MELKLNMQAAPEVKIMINIGALLDISTGTYVTGRYGESILNGGLSTLTGIVGIGNNFKSSVAHYMSFTACARMPKSIGSTYDTEINTHEWHLLDLLNHIPEFNGEDIFATGRWTVTDKTVYSGNKWYELQKDFLEDKHKNAAKYQVTTPFWNRDRSGPFKMLLPTFTELDSFSDFETDNITEMQNDNELGDKGALTIHMQQGLAKLRFLMDAPKLNAGNYNYLIMTAHLGKESTMQSAGGGREVPITKLKHLKNGDKIKGTTDKFTFITHNCWNCYNATPLVNDTTKGPEYPKTDSVNVKLDTDLNTVLLRNLRSKSGISGMTITLIVSQKEGVLPSLTEFHHIKESGRYGLEGSNVNYHLSLLPDVSLSRTTVRTKIDTMPRLRRALNITSEMCQMYHMWHTMEPGLLCTPKELYEDIKALGYDWDVLLDTRGWWTYDNDKHPIPYLSTMDLLKMRRKNNPYVPYWLDKDKKVISKKK